MDEKDDKTEREISQPDDASGEQPDVEVSNSQEVDETPSMSATEVLIQGIAKREEILKALAKPPTEFTEYHARAEASEKLERSFFDQIAETERFEREQHYKAIQHNLGIRAMPDLGSSFDDVLQSIARRDEFIEALASPLTRLTEMSAQADALGKMNRSISDQAADLGHFGNKDWIDAIQNSPDFRTLSDLAAQFADVTGSNLSVQMPANLLVNTIQEMSQELADNMLSGSIWNREAADNKLRDLLRFDPSEVRVLPPSIPSSYEYSNASTPAYLEDPDELQEIIKDAFKQAFQEVLHQYRNIIKARGKPSQWDSTQIGLEKLINLRNERRQAGEVTISKTKACELVGIDRKTVKTHRPDLWANWDDPDYEG